MDVKQIKTIIKIMTREELLKSPGYHLAGVQIDVCNMVRDCGLKELGITKKELRKIKAGDYDPKLSRLIELACNLGHIPKIEFVKV